MRANKTQIVNELTRAMKAIAKEHKVSLTYIVNTLKNYRKPKKVKPITKPISIEELKEKKKEMNQNWIISRAISVAKKNKPYNALKLSKKRMAADPATNIKDIITNEIKHLYPTVDGDNLELLVETEKKYWIFPKFSYLLDPMFMDQVDEVVSRINKIPKKPEELEVFIDNKDVFDLVPKQIIREIQILLRVNNRNCTTPEERIYRAVKRNVYNALPMNIIDIVGSKVLYDNPHMVRRYMSDYLRIQYIADKFYKRIAQLEQQNNVA